MNIKLPLWLTTVTPLSKNIALILFIALPFIGFFTGLKYARLAVTSPRPSVKIMPYASSTPRPTANIPSPTVTPTASYKPETIIQKPQSSAKFDRCGNIIRYRRSDWIGNFEKKLASNGIHEEEISDSCLTLDDKFLIFIVPGIYCSEADIYMYDTLSNLLEKAKLDLKGYQGCLEYGVDFGPKAGAIIPLEGHGGDAGCSGDDYFDYDFTKNLVTLKKTYGICENDIIEGRDGSWTYY